ncbi:MAG TPA: lysophospholipid acyltransferase family protein [Thermoanaerobaculia bacterium]|nr:lysophospholipid acyltransferase family protein [Thermoanaerobaculia bacterium]
MSVAATRGELPPHAPEAGWVRRLLGPFYVTGVFWFRIHRWGVQRVPEWALGSTVWLFSLFFYVALRNIRAAIASNLEAVLGPCGWWERERRIFRTMWTFAWSLSERYERLSTDRRFTIESESWEHWQEMGESGEGFILVTAHVGNWEVGSMVPAAEEKRRVHLVREAETDPRAQRFIADLIRSRSCNLYTTHFAEDPQLGMLLLDALRQGEIVALQGDRPRCGGKVAEVELFGRPFPIPVGPAALARAAGVPILPVFVLREGRRRYRCSIREPIRVAQSDDRHRDIEEALARFAGELQWAIRRQPHQWFCFRKLWD